jgi:hypothetical protein
MDTSESFASMEGLTERRLQPWKHLIYGIHSLYAGDIPGCKAALEAVKEGSPPGVLKPLFRAWIARQETGRRKPAAFNELTGAVGGLYQMLLVEPHPLSPLAEQAEEALNHGLTEQFAVLAGKVMRALMDQKQGDGPLLALRYVRYCLDLLDTAGGNDADFAAVTLKNLGEADGFCALGFARIGKDDAAAATALEKAVSAGGGRFLDAAMSSLVSSFLPALRERGRRFRRIPAAPFGPSTGGHGAKYPVFGSRKSDGQLELFEEVYG